MSKVLDNLKYAESHEWVRVDGNTAVIGITDYAQESLGSIVYVDLGAVGDRVEQFGEFGAVESVKAASDLIAPVTGKIIAINEEVVDNPELVNEDAYENWLIKVELEDTGELDKLLDAAAYRELLG
ncbi:MAG: glycine cleavage system protein GcvH [Bacillota bacterium]|jgi:glycine cleavage system H protein|nr:glycine cleavage system protein GcvH [Bacillota bacterium]NLM32295.1 glycine cleavage system protein GcvH [Acholeplasmataceae bacterium]HOA78909.1 glycine cleavage system protein GcvH [Bacilli bacterium]HPZ27655.1 glycine cleavage system protein GcvH [Bacilli bacterium]HQC89986.1 glycine cleavage system protein GcvH [Bacilli bacterium]